MYSLKKDFSENQKTSKKHPKNIQKTSKKHLCYIYSVLFLFLCICSSARLLADNQVNGETNKKAKQNMNNPWHPLTQKDLSFTTKYSLAVVLLFGVCTRYVPIAKKHPGMAKNILINLLLVPVFWLILKYCSFDFIRNKLQSGIDTRYRSSDSQNNLKLDVAELSGLYDISKGYLLDIPIADSPDGAFRFFRNYETETIGIYDLQNPSKPIPIKGVLYHEFQEDEPFLFQPEDKSGTKYALNLQSGKVTMTTDISTFEQTDSKQTDSNQTDSEQTDSNQTDSKQTDSEQTDSEQTDSNQTDSKQTDSEQTDSEQTDSKQLQYFFLLLLAIFGFILRRRFFRKSKKSS